MHYDGIEGKVAIVTGSGGGIGEAYARGLAAHGAKVVVAEIDKAGGERVAAAIAKDGGEASFVHVDVGSVDSTLAMAERTTELHGGIDFLVNNAAIFGTMKLAGLTNVVLAAKTTPIMPAQVAPRAKAVSLVRVLSMPIAWQAISSSLKAIQARPIRECCRRLTTKIVKSTKAIMM